MQNSKIRALSVFTLLGVSAYLLLAIYTAASGFGGAGGQLNVLSHSADIQIESDSVGDVVTVAGNRNQVTQPEPAPPPTTDKRGAWLGTGCIGGFVLFLILFIGIVYKFNPIEVKQNGTG